MEVNLGPLEQRLLDEIWSRKNVTVRELIESTAADLAYTTVMTTLDRLYKKGLLQRSEDGRAFRYSARYAPEDIRRGVMMATMRRWILSMTPSSLPLSCFVEALGHHDEKLLDELRELVRQKKMQLKKQKDKTE